MSQLEFWMVDLSPIALGEKEAHGFLLRLLFFVSPKQTFQKDCTRPFAKPSATLWSFAGVLSRVFLEIEAPLASLLECA